MGYSRSSLRTGAELNVVSETLYSDPRLKFRRAIPQGWGVDKEGHMTDDPHKVLEDGGLLCLGGSEETGGYKGYSWSMMVEVLGGILSGGPFGKNIRY